MPSTTGTIVHCIYHSDKLWWYPITLHYFPQGVPVNTGKGFYIVDETYVQAGIPFDCLLHDVPTDKYLLYLNPSLPKTSLPLFVVLHQHLMIFLPITFAATDIRVVPHQFSLLVRSPFCSPDNNTLPPIPQEQSH